MDRFLYRVYILDTMQYRENCRFINTSFEVQIEAETFSEAGSFSNGLAKVHTIDGSGYINTSGQLVIEPRFVDAGDFAEGLACVRMGGSQAHGEHHWQYIDTQGRVVINADFDFVHNFSEGVAVAQEGSSIFLINREGKVRTLLTSLHLQVPLQSDVGFRHGLLVVRDATSGKYGYVDMKGRIAISPRFENAASFSEGLARASVLIEGRELLGFINGAGEFTIAPTYDVDFDFLRTSHDFSEGLAGVIDGPPTMSADPCFVFIDKEGEVKVKAGFFYAGPFRNGFAVAYDAKTDRHTYINKLGEQMVPSKFTRAANFSEGLAFVAVSKP